MAKAPPAPRRPTTPLSFQVDGHSTDISIRLDISIDGPGSGWRPSRSGTRPPPPCGHAIATAALPPPSGTNRRRGGSIYPA
eukprot:3052062-Pyramimonas_sp.AAC.1